MAHDIEVRDEGRHGEIKHQLYVNGHPKALLTIDQGQVQINWQVYGPQYWPEAKDLVRGLLQLSALADQLSVKNNGH